jgi:thiamine biosynthesis lipoprotein
LIESAAATRLLARFGWLWACGLWLVACSPQTSTFRADALVFGSAAQFAWRADASTPSDAILADILLHLKQREQDWSLWQPSALTIANQGCASGDWFEWPAALQPLYAPSMDWWERSDGLFNPAAGKIIAAWSVRTSALGPTAAPPSPPSQTALDTWRADPAGPDDIEFLGTRARCLHRELQWDFNAIAEGVATQEVADLLRAKGIHNALITLGGDVLAVGRGEHHAWRAAIRHPDGGVVAWLDLHDGEALFTSGTYARQFDDAQGRQWSHIIDPRSGEAVRGPRAVSVLHRDPVLADAAATALLAANDSELERIATRLDVRCLLRMDEYGEWWISDALQPRLHWQTTPARVHRMALGEHCE